MRAIDDSNVEDAAQMKWVKSQLIITNLERDASIVKAMPSVDEMSYDDSITAHNKQAGSIKEKEHAKIADVMKNNGKGLVTPEEAYNRRAKMKQGEVIRKGFIKSLKIAEHKADLKKIKNAKKF